MPLEILLVDRERLHCHRQATVAVADDAVDCSVAIQTRPGTRARQGVRSDVRRCDGSRISRVTCGEAAIHIGAGSASHSIADVAAGDVTGAEHTGRLLLVNTCNPPPRRTDHSRIGRGAKRQRQDDTQAAGPHRSLATHHFISPLVRLFASDKRIESR